MPGMYLCYFLCWHTEVVNESLPSSIPVNVTVNKEASKMNLGDYSALKEQPSNEKE